MRVSLREPTPVFHACHIAGSSPADAIKNLNEFLAKYCQGFFVHRTEIMGKFEIEDLQGDRVAAYLGDFVVIGDKFGVLTPHKFWNEFAIDSYFNLYE